MKKKCTRKTLPLSHWPEILKEILKGILKESLKGSVGEVLEGILREPLKEILQGSQRKPSEESLRNPLRKSLRDPLRESLRDPLRNPLSIPLRACFVLYFVLYFVFGKRKVSFLTFPGPLKKLMENSNEKMISRIFTSAGRQKEKTNEKLY